MSDKPINLPDSLEDAERFKRLFIDPAVDGVCERVEAHLAPVIEAQKQVLSTLKDHGDRIESLEGKQTKALIGWGVFATGISVALSASWGWVAKKIGWTPVVALGLVLLVAAGPATRPSGEVTRPAVVMRVYDPTLERYANMWQAEVNRRFTGAVVALVHGGDFVTGQWIVADGHYESGPHVRPALTLVDELHERYPDRVVVLIACNPGHIEVKDRPWLYYAMSSIWCVPDRDVATATQTNLTLNGHVAEVAYGTTRSDEEPDVVGSIFEFVNGG